MRGTNGIWNNLGGTVTINATSTLYLDGNMTANGRARLGPGRDDQRHYAPGLRGCY